MLTRRLLAALHGFARMPLGPRRHQLGEFGAVVGHPTVAALGEPWEPRECGGWNPPAGQEPQQRRKGRASRVPFAAGRDQVPRGHSVVRCEVGEQPVGLGSLQGDRRQASFAIPAEEACEQPLA